MLKRIAFSQFNEYEKQGKDPRNARPLIILLVSILLMLLVLVLYFLGTKVFDSYLHFGERRYSAKFVGRAIGFLTLGTVYVLPYMGLGKSAIEKYARAFEQMDEATRQAEGKKAFYYFLIPFIGLLGTIIIMAFNGVLSN